MQFISVESSKHGRCAIAIMNRIRFQYNFVLCCDNGDGDDDNVDCHHYLLVTVASNANIKLKKRIFTHTNTHSHIHKHSKCSPQNRRLIQLKLSIAIDICMTGGTNLYRVKHNALRAHAYILTQLVRCSHKYFLL